MTFPGVKFTSYVYKTDALSTRLKGCVETPRSPNFFRPSSEHRVKLYCFDLVICGDFWIYE